MTSFRKPNPIFDGSPKSFHFDRRTDRPPVGGRTRTEPKTVFPPVRMTASAQNFSHPPADNGHGYGGLCRGGGTITRRRNHRGRWWGGMVRPTKRNSGVNRPVTGQDRRASPLSYPRQTPRMRVKRRRRSRRRSLRPSPSSRESSTTSK